MSFARLSFAFVLLLTVAAVAPVAVASAPEYDRTERAIEGAKRRAMSGAMKGAIGGAVAGLVVGVIGAIQRLTAKQKPDEERNLKEPGRPYF